MKVFSNIALKNGFSKSFGGWYKESKDVLLILDLQKSNFGSYFDLNIKIFIQGCFGRDYVKTKSIFNNEIGNIFTRQPKEYNEFLNLDSKLLDSEIVNGLEILFLKYINPLTVKALSKEGIIELYKSDELFLLPAIKKELNISF